MPSKKLESYLKTISGLLQDRGSFNEVTRRYYNQLKRENDELLNKSKQLPNDLSERITIEDNTIMHS